MSAPKVNTIVYMTPVHTAADAWWQEHSGVHRQRALLSTQRVVQRERDVAGWRRNLIVGALVLAIPVVVSLIGAL
jgi:hypothetical protein